MVDRFCFVMNSNKTPGRNPGLWRQNLCFCCLCSGSPVVVHAGDIGFDGVDRQRLASFVVQPHRAFFRLFYPVFKNPKKSSCSLMPPVEADNPGLLSIVSLSAGGYDHSKAPVHGLYSRLNIVQPGIELRVFREPAVPAHAW